MGRMTKTSRNNLAIKDDRLTAYIEPKAGRYAIRLRLGDGLHTYVSGLEGPVLYETEQKARLAVWRANRSLAARLQRWEPSSKRTGEHCPGVNEGVRATTSAPDWGGPGGTPPWRTEEFFE
jgi:hypothetical protein